ncbi:hypothetical protein [Pseudoxanthomonas daejeonensis]|uniref:Uncharacterized protein n=1 Tax=Pseudoxanthomonas daejeonensis TaxID=266062 RepID=A0ABQ6Z624_9GAMM|nr:hypothetical protein [Pseudoxanthomonas daejeonensis]KAF1694000.1 hypothetical protein CSC65_10075 [Pseudoxanthomonas daejeonensis]
MARRNRSGIIAGALLALLATTHAGAAPVVDSIELNGATVWKTSAIPDGVVGEYLYEKQGEPKIVLAADGTGSFQAHMVAPIPIRYWVLANEAGEPVKESGGANYRYTIVLQYGPGGGGNYPEGGFDSWYWTWLADDGCANILGERFKCG